MAGKGDKLRPLSVTQDEWDKNYEEWLKKLQEAKSG